MQHMLKIHLFFPRGNIVLHVYAVGERGRPFTCMALVKAKYNGESYAWEVQGLPAPYSPKETGRRYSSKQYSSKHAPSVHPGAGFLPPGNTMAHSASLG